MPTGSKMTLTLIRVYGGNEDLISRHMNPVRLIRQEIVTLHVVAHIVLCLLMDKEPESELEELYTELLELL